MPLLYRAALQGIFGKRTEFSRSSITDALFVYLDGEPETESMARVDSCFRDRPLVCLTGSWEGQIQVQHPDVAIYRRTMMKPANRFNGEVEMDISTKETHRGKNLAGKFGFETETAYPVYWLPRLSPDKTKQSGTGFF